MCKYLDSETKKKLKEILPNAIFHLRVEKLQKKFLSILGRPDEFYH